MRKQASVSRVEARRIALAAQLFGTKIGPPQNIRSCANVVRRLGALQIDSVNVLVRSHYLPLFSRLGPYSPAVLERAAYDPQRRVLFEYWGHEASLLPVDFHPLFRWRMEMARAGEGTWGRLKRYAVEHGDLVQAALAQIRERGALGAGELKFGRSRGGWWGWSQGKEILEWLFWTGEVSTAGRRKFERLYDLTERVLPRQVLAVAPLPKEVAQRQLMSIAAGALGIATLRDLRDYFRLPTADATARLQELIDAGALIPVSVEGWKQPGYLDANARQPRKIQATALLSPFDSLIWERQRTQQLFDFHYRLEIYTPPHKRQHGYYVLPLLHEERLVARVDLKADRPTKCLQIRAGSVEAGVAANSTMAPLLDQLQLMAQWLGLDTFKVISRRGELMRALRKATR